MEKINRLLKKCLLAIFGLMICSVGIYLSLIANVGLIPWDTLNMGLVNVTHISYGKINIMVSLTILLIDILLKERIGLGTIFDAILTGIFIDILYVILPINSPNNLFIGLIYFTVGMIIVCFGTSVYMRAGLSCGPRDSLLVGIGKRFPKIKIGYIDIAIKVLLVVVSYFIKGPIGIGTLYGTVTMGFLFNIVFGILKFEPRSVVHEDILQTVNSLK